MAGDKRAYQDALLNLLEPLLPYYSDGCARLRLGGGAATYSVDVQEFEGFARPLWGLVPFFRGGGAHAQFKSIYQRGLACGTDPNHEEYWGSCSDNDQRFVEMAPIAYALLYLPEFFWDPYSKEEQEHIATYLQAINDHSLPHCNWLFFRVLVNLALKKRGAAYSESRLEEDLAHIDSWYLGEGWYVDGRSDQKDYYGPFAMHFYGLIWADCMPEDRLYTPKFIERAQLFAPHYLHWFAEGGSAIPYGRSLTYRFAHVAFWSMAVATCVPTIELGVVKGLIARNLAYWASQPIYHGDGVLSVGYCYPNLTMAEKYNSPTSPYWCTKAYALLALDDEHPYWSAEELPLGIETAVISSPVSDMLIQHRRWDVCAYPVAVYNKNVLGHFVEKYAKFAYSTTFGFSVAHSCETVRENAPDSMLAFIVGDRVYVRRRCIDARIEERRVVTRWSPCDGIIVNTEITIVDGGHIRRHEIHSTIACLAWDCGFSVSQWSAGSEQNSLEGWACAYDGSHGCKVQSVLGGGQGAIIDADPNTNVIAKKTMIPAIIYEITPGEQTIETLIEVY